MGLNLECSRKPAAHVLTPRPLCRCLQVDDLESIEALEECE
jgi:hypothetical protein